MAEDAAEPGSRKDPPKSKSRSVKATLTGFSIRTNLEEAVREEHNPRNSRRQIVTSRATDRIDRVSFFSRNQEFSERQGPGANIASVIMIDTFPIFPNDPITSKKIECRSSI